MAKYSGESQCDTCSTCKSCLKTKYIYVPTETKDKVMMLTAFALVGIAFLAVRSASSGGISSDYSPLPGGYIPAEGIMKLNRRF